MPYKVNDPFYGKSSRYLRNAKSGNIALAIDLTVLPAFPGIAAPAAPTTVTATTGGTLPAASYSYTQTSVNANGETTASPPVVQVTTGATSTVTVTLAAEAGAVTQNIYRGNQLLATNLVPGSAFVDTGGVTPNPAIAAPTVNSTQVIANAVIGQINAGDSVYRTALGVASLRDPANSANYIGESEDNYPQTLGIGANVLIGAPDGDPNIQRIAVKTSGEFRKKTVPGVSYAPGALVYLGPDPQTVTTVATGTAMGRVADDQNPVAGTFSGAIVGATSQDVVIAISPPAVV
jgi:hypothetical protein